MEFHRGRLIDHVHLRVKDVEASKRFYRAVLGAVGLSDALDECKGYFNADELFVDKSPSRRRIARRSLHFTELRWRPEAATTERPGSGTITPAITRLSCSTPTATMSRSCSMDRPIARRHPSS